MPIEPTDIGATVSEKIRIVKNELAKKIYGQASLIDLLPAGIAARGHWLLTGVPGLAKSPIGSSCWGAWHRGQFR